VDGDGDPDLAFAGSDPTELWRNDGGTLVGPVWSPTNTFWGCQDLDWADIDNDGDEDLATIHFSNRQIRIYLNRNGVLDQVPSWVYALGSSATEIAFGDVNSDGYVDLAAGTARVPLVLFYNQGPSVDAPVTPAAASAPSLAASPNPFRGSVRLTLPRAASREGTLRVVDAAGRLVRSLPVAAGSRDVQWDGRGADGRPASAGVYWMTADVGETPLHGRAVRIR